MVLLRMTLETVTAKYQTLLHAYFWSMILMQVNIVTIEQK